MILDGKTALVTGASGGLGKEIAISLSKEGCRVYITGRNKEKINLLKKELGAYCLDAYMVDLSDLKQIKDMTKNINVDILINCAGVFPINSLEETNEVEFNNCIDINLRAPFFLTKYLVPNMKENGWGRVVNIGSSSAYGGFKNTSTYCSSKHALLGLTRSLYNELKEDNIRVFCVSPGSIKTPMGKTVQDQDYSTFMEPTEIADFIIKIISYNSNMIPEETRLNRVAIK